MRWVTGSDVDNPRSTRTDRPASSRVVGGARVHGDHHVEVDRHYYSVPHTYSARAHSELGGAAFRPTFGTWRFDEAIAPVATAQTAVCSFPATVTGIANHGF